MAEKALLISSLSCVQSNGVSGESLRWKRIGKNRTRCEQIFTIFCVQIVNICKYIFEEVGCGIDLLM